MCFNQQPSKEELKHVHNIIQLKLKKFNKQNNQLHQKVTTLLSTFVGLMSLFRIF